MISAAAFEYAPLREQLQSRSFYSDAQFFEVGIGPINSAQFVASNLTSFKNKNVIYIGTAGTFGNFEGVRIVRAATVQWLPTCERHGLSYAVKPDPILKLDRPLSALAELDSVKVICSTNVSLSNELPVELIPKNTVENLELYSCARQIAGVSASFTGILGITNAIGKDAHQQWRSNFHEAAQLSASIILSLQERNKS